MTELPSTTDAARAEAVNRIEAYRRKPPADQTLDLSRLGLTNLPPEIARLTTLATLNLSYNVLQSLPHEVSQLTVLTSLNLNNNQFKALTPVIGRLKTLKSLNLNNNQLTSLPPQVAQLKSLTSLYLSNNQLKSLPAEVSELTSLNSLNLSYNQLTTLPAEVAQLTSLASLNLYNNQLTTLPPEIAQLTTLTSLYLHENPALGLSTAILGPTIQEVFGKERKMAARPGDILNFYFDRQHAAITGTLRRLNEIKLMLVGRGGAGKTSLRRFFMHEPHDADEKETPGIALDSFDLPHDSEAIKVRLWDFAGQEITHALHQFFLTDACVYVLVLDPRSNTEGGDAEYWLNLLKRYAGDSPVLVALNRQDARRGGYDVDRNALQERFPFIRAFVRTNCKTREGCEDLRWALRRAIQSLDPLKPPHLEVPNSWLVVKDDCFARGSETTRSKLSQQHLSLAEFRELCAKHGVLEESKQESLARLLHQLGAVLHFVDEPRLRDTAVLNPHWVTDGVYRLLRAKEGIASDGILPISDALAAIPGESEKTARFLLRLMERFEMCFPEEDAVDGPHKTQKWLIPGALTEFQPDEVGSNWQEPGSVRLRYVYDPLPEGVLPRFIVMTHLLSQGNPRWRNGVILQDGNARALVRRGEKLNYVEVTAFGPDLERLRLLEIIQGNLDRIHADLPDPKPVAYLELAGLPGIFRPIVDLEAAEAGKQQVAIQTTRGPALVDPAPQLDQASERQARNSNRIPLNTFLSYAHEDTKAKTVFQDNLNVMAKKNLVSPWHDGLIELGTEWLEQIQRKLGEMDVFIGLLTNAFVLSDFIRKVEIDAAREKLRALGKDFLFILILVEDIPLEGLDLAGYQILKPGGRAVSRFRSRKEGFLEAQKELEKLFQTRQELLASQNRPTQSDDLAPRPSHPSEGVTILVHSDSFEQSANLSGEHNIPATNYERGRIESGKNLISQQFHQELSNCESRIQILPSSPRKELLQRIDSAVKVLVNSLPENRKDEASQIVENWEILVKQATSEKPNRKWYSVSAEGLLELAESNSDLSSSIRKSVLTLGQACWPDFLLQ